MTLLITWRANYQAHSIHSSIHPTIHSGHSKGRVTWSDMSTNSYLISGSRKWKRDRSRAWKWLMDGKKSRRRRRRKCTGGVRRQMDVIAQQFIPGHVTPRGLLLHWIHLMTFKFHFDEDRKEIRKRDEKEGEGFKLWIFKYSSWKTCSGQFISLSVEWPGQTEMRIARGLSGVCRKINRRTDGHFWKTFLWRFHVFPLSPAAVKLTPLMLDKFVYWFKGDFNGCEIYFLQIMSLLFLLSVSKLFFFNSN